MMNFKKPDTPKDAYLQYLAGNKDIVLPEPKTDKDLALYKMCVNGTSWNDLTDKPFGEEVTVKEVLAECQAFSAEGGDQLLIDTPSTENLTIGAKYIVTWNGVDYSATAYDAIMDFGPGPQLINDSADMESGDGAVFVIGISTEGYEGIYGAAMAFDDSTTATVSIRKVSETIKPIDPKYLPEGSGGGGVTYYYFSSTERVLYKDIALTDAVTIADMENVLANGKFREVYDGEAGGDIFFGGSAFSNPNKTMGFKVIAISVYSDGTVNAYELKSSDYKSAAPV